MYCSFSPKSFSNLSRLTKNYSSALRILSFMHLFSFLSRSNSSFPLSTSSFKFSLISSISYISYYFLHRICSYFSFSSSISFVMILISSSFCETCISRIFSASFWIFISFWKDYNLLSAIFNFSSKSTFSSSKFLFLSFMSKYSETSISSSFKFALSIIFIPKCCFYCISLKYISRSVWFPYDELSLIIISIGYWTLNVSYILFSPLLKYPKCPDFFLISDSLKFNDSFGKGLTNELANDSWSLLLYPISELSQKSNSGWFSHPETPLFV